MSFNPNVRIFLTGARHGVYGVVHEHVAGQGQPVFDPHSSAAELQRHSPNTEKYRLTILTGNTVFIISNCQTEIRVNEIPSS